MTGDVSIDKQRKPARRRWLRFGLRTLLVLVTACAGIFALWRAEVRRDAREQAAVASIKWLGDSVQYSDRAPGWLRRVVGPNRLRMLHTVVGIQFAPGGMHLGDGYTAGIYDARLAEMQAAIEQLPNLEELDLSDSTITDEGLKALDNVKTLKRVVLVNAPVTEAGVEALRRTHQDLVVGR